MTLISSAPQGIEHGAPLNEAMRIAFEAIAVRAQSVSPSEMTIARRRSLVREDIESLSSQPLGNVQCQALSMDLAQRCLAARLYTPQSVSSNVLMVYFHGGGWVLGDLDTHHASCERLAHHLGCKLLSVEYRKAPEHPFPAACDDAFDALAWANVRMTAWGCQRLAVGGDSAGGHLAAVAMHAHSALGELAIAGALLFYPVTDMQFKNRSYRERGQGLGLTSDAMQWFWQQFLCPDMPLAQHVLQLDARALPMRQNWALPPPPTVIVAAWHDPLYDEGVQYAQLLHAAGGIVRLHSAPDLPHSFLRFTGVVPAAHTHMLDAVKAFITLLAEA